MVSITRLFVILALHQSASAAAPDANVAHARNEAFASLVSISRRQSGDMWLTKQTDLILTAIEHDTLNLTPDQRISCIRAMHDMIANILQTVEARPDIHIHRMATILEAARLDRDNHPAQFSHELLITNIALRFLNDVGMDILSTFPGLIPDPQRQSAIGRIVTVMQAMGFTFNHEERIGFCADTTALFFSILTRSSEELVAYANNLQVAFDGMNALTLQSGVAVKWTYAPIAMTMFYCIPSLSSVPFDTRLQNMELLSGFVGGHETDVLSQDWAVVMRNFHSAGFAYEARLLRLEIVNALAVKVSMGAGSQESEALETVRDYLELVVRRPRVFARDSIRAKIQIEELLRSIQDGAELPQNRAFLQARITQAVTPVDEAAAVPIPPMIVPASVAAIPATSAVLVRIRNSLTIIENTVGGYRTQWLLSVTSELILQNTLSASKLAWLDNYLETRIWNQDSWTETACLYSQYLGVKVLIDHPHLPRAGVPRDRFIPLAKKLCSNLIYSMGATSRHEFFTRHVTGKFTTSSNPEDFFDDFFEFTLAYKEFQADPDWEAGNAAIGFVPSELLTVYHRPTADSRGFGEFLRLESSLYARRALRGSDFPLEVRAKIASHARPWKMFEPLIKRFEQVYRTYGTKILIDMRNYETPYMQYQDLNMDSRNLLGRAQRIFARAFRALTVLGFLGEEVPAAILPLKGTSLRFIGAYVEFLEELGQVEIRDLEHYTAWKKIMQKALSKIWEFDNGLWDVASEGHAVENRSQVEKCRAFIRQTDIATQWLLSYAEDISALGEAEPAP